MIKWTDFVSSLSEEDVSNLEETIRLRRCYFREEDNLAAIKYLQSKRIQNELKGKDLYVEFWWEPTEDKFYAVARDQTADDGYTGFGASPEQAILNALAARTLCQVED